MPNGDVDTLHQDGKWLNKVEGHSTIEGIFDTKSEAVAAGRELARSLKVEHIIRNENGQIAERNSYENEPRDAKA